MILPENKFSHLKGVNRKPMDIRTHTSKDVYFPVFSLLYQEEPHNDQFLISFHSTTVTFLHSSSSSNSSNSSNSFMSWLTGAFDFITYRCQKPYLCMANLWNCLQTFAVINHTAMGRAQFMFYKLFTYFFFSFVGDQTQTSSPPNFESRNLWCLFTKSCWHINRRTMFFLLCVKYIFFWFYRSVGYEGNNKYAKKGITSAMECVDIASFTFATWQIRSCLLCKFLLPGATVFLVFRVFFIFLDKRSELWCCKNEVSSEIGRKIKYLQAK